MATFFIAKDGSDSNGGTSYADAKLTIGGAIATAGAGTHTFMIGPGTYNEAVSATVGVISYTLQGDGYVILDGGGVLGIGINLGGSGIGSNVHIINDLIIRGYTQGTSGTTSSSAGAALAYSRVRIQNCTTGFNQNATALRGYTWRNCLFHDCTTGTTFSVANATNTHTMTRCTWSDCTTGISRTATGGLILNFRHNIYAFNTKHLNFTTITATVNEDFNDIYFDGTATSTWSATTTTSFATWKSTSSQDANSVSVNPIFIDREHKAYDPHTSSPLFGSTVLAEVGDGSGAGHRTHPSVGMSENDPDGNFAGKFLTNTTTNTAGNIELSAGSSGTARTPVINLGRVRNIRRINIVTTLDDVLYPANVPDFSTSDIQPKRMTFRWRGSTTAFVNADATPVFTEIEPDALGDLVLTSVQYVQVEVTLRSDGS